MDTEIIDSIFNPVVDFEPDPQTFFEVKIDDYHHTLSYGVRESDFALIRNYFEGNFREQKTREKYIELYFFLLYLYEQSGTYVEITYSKLSKIFDCAIGTVSSMVKRMVEKGLMIVDKEKWALTKKNKEQGCFGYELKGLDELNLDDARKDKRLKIGKLKRLKYKYDNELKLYINNKFIEIINEQNNLCIILSNSSDNDLNNNNLDTILSQNEQKAQILDSQSEIPDFVHYIADYNTIQISADNIVNDASVTIKDRKEILQCAKNWYKKPTIGNDNRIYHAFHRFPRELREKCLSYNGSPLIEVSDIHNAYYVFMCKLLEQDKKLFRNLDFDVFELPEFEKLVMSGKFYESVLDGIPHSILTGKPELDELNRKADREKVKQALQSYRNEKPGRMEYRFEEIDRWFERTFPTVRQFLRDYPKQENGKKFLQRDIARIETDIMSNISKDLHDNYGVTPFPLHDAIFLSEHDNGIIKAHNVNIDNLLLKYLDLKFYQPK